LSKDWEKVQVTNVSYTIKNAIDFFKLRSLEVLKEEIEEAVQINDSALGEKLISEYKRVEKPIGKGINLLKNSSEIVQAFSREHEILFQYPGDLGKCLGPFARGDFFAIIGEEKKGKTQYLWYTAYRALMLGYKVLFVSLEMSKNQMLRRMWQGMVGQPVKTEHISIPYFKEVRDGRFEIKHRKEKRKGIDTDIKEIEKKQRFYRKMVRTGAIQLIAYPSDGASVDDLKTELINLEYYEGFIPDVIVIDYADIMKLSNQREYRHQLDQVWKALRGIAQERSALVVTGSQVNDRGRVAEDRRKLAHVTIMMRIEQDNAEEELGIIMMSTVVQREGKAYRGKIGVLQCYEIGRPYLNSLMVDKIKFDNKEAEK
jgi:replicative DNA helicase